MPGNPTSRIRQFVRLTAWESRNASADANASTSRPDCCNESGSDSRTDSLSSTTHTRARALVASRPPFITGSKDAHPGSGCRSDFGAVPNRWGFLRAHHSGRTVHDGQGPQGAETELILPGGTCRAPRGARSIGPQPIPKSYGLWLYAGAFSASDPRQGRSQQLTSVGTLPSATGIENTRALDGRSELEV